MNFIKKGLTLFKLGTLLKDWKRYNPSEYDGFIDGEAEIVGYHPAREEKLIINKYEKNYKYTIFKNRF